PRLQGFRYDAVKLPLAAFPDVRFPRMRTLFSRGSAALRLLLAALALVLVGSVSAWADSPAAGRATYGSAGLRVDSATIASGRLVIVGTAKKKGVVVRVEGQPIKATARASKRFQISSAWRPATCAVVLTVGSKKQSVQ